MEQRGSHDPVQYAARESPRGGPRHPVMATVALKASGASCVHALSASNLLLPLLTSCYHLSLLFVGVGVSDIW